MKFPFENRIWDPAETLPRDELRVLQGRRLAETVARAEGVPFYRHALARADVDAGTIRSPDDVRRLPLTEKDDLRRNYPLGLLAVGFVLALDVGHPVRGPQALQRVRLPHAVLPVLLPARVDRLVRAVRRSHPTSTALRPGRATRRPRRPA